MNSIVLQAEQDPLKIVDMVFLRPLLELLELLVPRQSSTVPGGIIVLGFVVEQ